MLRWKKKASLLCQHDARTYTYIRPRELNREVSDILVDGAAKPEVGVKSDN